MTSALLLVALSPFHSTPWQAQQTTVGSAALTMGQVGVGERCRTPRVIASPAFPARPLLPEELSRRSGSGPVRPCRQQPSGVPT